jgi:two-component system NtrC family sensor kinase
LQHQRPLTTGDHALLLCTWHTTMTFNLRTTICINMLILMIAAIGLISIVVFRVSENEIRLQQQHAADQVFISITATLSAVLHDKNTLPHPAVNLKAYLNLLAATMDCDIIVLADRNGRVLANTGNTVELPGPHGRSGAIPTHARTHSLQRDTNRTVIRHLCSGPVMAGTQVLAYLTIGFPTAQTNARINTAARMIFMYMALVGAIIFFFGIFLLSRYVVRPVNRLSRDMQTLAGGVLPRVQEPDSGNEIDTLGSTLKALYNGLKQEQHNTAAQLTEITAQNRQLEQARHEILQSEKMASVGRLAAGIAHEIGNPAGIATGYIHMLKESDISEDQRSDFLARMEREVERISATIRELLDFAQPSTKEAAPVQLNDIINDCRALFSYQRDMNNCTIVFEPEEALPLIYANASLLRQLMVNLILNARDAMSDAGTIHIDTRLITDDNKIELTIDDTGCGILPEHQALIFDPFFTTKDPGKGTGLGLSNAHRIVEIHGGTITVTSEPDRGTRFTITFPIHTEPLLT